MKVRIIKKQANGTEEYSFVDENGKPAKGIFTVKDGRPFDLIMNEYAD